MEQVFEPGHVDVVLGGRAENTELLEQRFDYVFFTGSVSVGKLVMEKASRWPTPVSLELGGKSPCVVCADANLDVAAARIAFGKYLNCGQTCVAPDYLLVDERVADELLDKLKAQVVAMYGADAFANADWGRIVNEKHFDRIMGLIKPAKVVLGGRGRRETLQIEPTIMRGCTGEDAVMQEEIFGPVLPVLTYRSLQEAEGVHQGPREATGAVPVHQRQEHAEALPAPRALRRRVRQRHHRPPGHEPHGLRRRGRQRHGLLPRHPQLQDIQPREEHPEEAPVDRPAHALPAIHAAQGEAHEDVLEVEWPKPGQSVRSP